jgi:hypothetical protein
VTLVYNDHLDEVVEEPQLTRLRDGTYLEDRLHFDPLELCWVITTRRWADKDMRTRLPIPEQIIRARKCREDV